MNDAIGNQVPLAIGSVISGESLRYIGTLARDRGDVGELRSEIAPAPKPIANQGAPGFEAYTWWGVFAPANCRRNSSKVFTTSLPKP